MLSDPAIRTPLAIALGAIAGAWSRYYITLWVVQRYETDFPWATFGINLTGCIVMGFFVTWAAHHVNAITPELRVLIATGFLGAYTTFSSYGMETVSLLRDRLFSTAFLYWMGSASLGLVGVQMGSLVASYLGRKP